MSKKYKKEKKIKTRRMRFSWLIKIAVIVFFCSFLLGSLRSCDNFPMFDLGTYLDIPWPHNGILGIFKGESEKEDDKDSSNDKDSSDSSNDKDSSDSSGEKEDDKDSSDSSHDGEDGNETSGENPEGEQKPYVITFYDGEQLYDTLTTNEQGYLSSFPHNPTPKEDYSFVGWFTTTGIQIKESISYNRDMICYAKYRKNQVVTITFYAHTEAEEIYAEMNTLETGKLVEFPDTPSSDLGFFGWYTLDNSGEKDIRVTLETIFDSDMDVYGFWYERTPGDGGGGSPGDIPPDFDDDENEGENGGDSSGNGNDGNEGENGDDIGNDIFGDNLPGGGHWTFEEYVETVLGGALVYDSTTAPPGVSDQELEDRGLNPDVCYFLFAFDFDGELSYIESTRGNEFFYIDEDWTWFDWFEYMRSNGDLYVDENGLTWCHLGYFVSNSVTEDGTEVVQYYPVCICLDVHSLYFYCGGHFFIVPDFAIDESMGTLYPWCLTVYRLVVNE